MSSLDLFARTDLPRWARVRQRLDTNRLDDVGAAVAEQFARPEIGERITPGLRVALAVGSRGIDRLDQVTRAAVAEVRRRGGEPFVVPAMGSHGGATAEGQIEVLAQYGVTPDAIGCPIRASMETVKLGELEDGLPVWFDKLAATEADVVVPINRVKPHTDFHAPAESGLIKMLAIGLGKQQGADTLHARGFDRFERVLPRVAQRTLSTIAVPFGVAVVENGHAELALIEAVPGDQILSREPELLALAREKLPRLPGESVDVLVVDQLGKDISGIGTDTNVVNRYYTGPLPFTPRIQRLIVRDLTVDTEGNASGLGLADIALRRAVSKVDPVKTYMNCITAKTPEGARIPLTVDNDREALSVALACCVRVSVPESRIVRIRDTKHLETFWASEPLLPELLATESVCLDGQVGPITFDADGMLPDEI